MDFKQIVVNRGRLKYPSIHSIYHEEKANRDQSSRQPTQEKK